MIIQAKKIFEKFTDDDGWQLIAKAHITLYLPLFFS